MRLGSRKPRQLELVDAGRIDEGLPGRVGQQRIGVADVAKFIIGSAQKLVAKAQVQGQALGRTIIVLSKPGVGGDAALVVPRAPPPPPKKPAPSHKVLNIPPNPPPPVKH